MGKKSKIVAIREEGSLESQPETVLRTEGRYYAEKERGIWANPSDGWKLRVREFNDSKDKKDKRNNVGLFLDLLQHSGIDVDQLLYDLHVYSTCTGPTPEERTRLEKQREQFSKIIDQIKELTFSIQENETIEKIAWREGIPSLDEQFNTILPPAGDIESALSILSAFTTHLAARNAYYSSKIQERNSKDNVLMALWREKIRAATGTNYCNDDFRMLVLAGQSASYGSQPDRDLSMGTLNKRLNTALEECYEE